MTAFLLPRSRITRRRISSLPTRIVRDRVHSLPQLQIQTSIRRLRRSDSIFQGSGPWTITITSSLHVLAPVLVDGTTQPGYDGAFNRIYVEGAAGVIEDISPASP